MKVEFSFWIIVMLQTKRSIYAFNLEEFSADEVQVFNRQAVSFFLCSLCNRLHTSHLDSENIERTNTPILWNPWDSAHSFDNGRAVLKPFAMSAFSFVAPIIAQSFLYDDCFF